MNNQWYALHVLTGAELEVQRHLKDQGVDAVVLREKTIIRRGGRWREELRVLFPGYVFLFIQFTPTMFYVLKATPGAIRLLPKDKPVPMSCEDCAWLLTFAGEDVIPPSTVNFSGKTPVIVDGPLKELEYYIVKYDRRRRRVSLRIPVLNEHKDIVLSIKPA